ncbi:carboxymuconolactone decarboxylase family protein [Ferruginibacter paludis]|uniref:carboxymuconolactone decarboxylase family protein n=1 Tax=Ferruginibacter paludis TaxID=1310417 RepID=UPI0025B3EEFB|nr:carboxymuconolactone decarboxylase family protein [Ferruginibacter paludis]MDN3655453.1 carboxymuconolactone decarboxylase family protein [Ferruginibacter paludis]
MFAQTTADTAVALNQKERSIILISAFTAQGNMPQLKIALNNGLSAGLTISEIKETLVQLYAYAGFPRSLNALHKLMEVLDERKTKGINDVLGKEPAEYSVKKTMLQTGTENQTKLVGSKIAGGVYEFAPAIDQFLKEHLFGAIFSRDNLDWKTRELITISALAAMEGVTPQLRSHYGVGMYNGLTAGQLAELSTVIEMGVDNQRGTIARQVLQSVIDKKPYVESSQPNDEIFPIGEKITNDNFIGTAWLNQLIQSDSINNIQVGNVTFEKGARTKWHYHPGGQILLALDGVGYYQEKGRAKRMLHKGDVVKCAANVPHWHGASPGDKFIQVAITDPKNGATVWLEAVGEPEYNSPL